MFVYFILIYSLRAAIIINKVELRYMMRPIDLDLAHRAVRGLHVYENVENRARRLPIVPM